MKGSTRHGGAAPPGNGASTPHELAVCAMFRDEAAYLREWIEFHRLVGVDHFYLFDNFSTDGFRDALAPYLEEGLVTLRDWPVPLEERGQVRMYEECLERYRAEARWMAFIDLDEFLFPPAAERIGDVLAELGDAPGVVVNWQNYGSSGHVDAPGGLVIEHFTRRARTSWVRNRRVKSIVDPTRTVRPLGAHYFEYRDGAPSVTENGEPVGVVPVRGAARKLRRLLARLHPALAGDPWALRHAPGLRVSVDRLRINHYPIKSREEYARKLLRFETRSGRGGLAQRHRGVDYFAYHDRNEVEDPVLHRYLPALRRALAARNAGG